MLLQGLLFIFLLGFIPNLNAFVPVATARGRIRLYGGAGAGQSSVSMSMHQKIAATVIATALAGPLGNIGAALQAIASNPDSLTCSLDNQNVADGQSSCQQLDNVVRFRAGKLFTIKQDWGGSVSTGAAVWNGENVAIWYMENVLGGKAFKEAKVLELGSGVGFSSLVASALGASQIAITDGNVEVLELAKDNIETNLDDATKKGIYTAQLRWNTEDEKNFEDTNWDFILASDVTYKRTSWPDLMHTIAQLSGSNTRTILSMEPRNIGEVDGVLKEAEKSGLRWSEAMLPIDKVKTQCNLSCARLFVLQKAVPVPPAATAA